VVTVEDLGEELLSSVVLANGTVVVGGEKGVLRIWKDGLGREESGRVVVERGETLDALGCAPAGMGQGEMVVVGMGDGRVRFVSVQKRKVVGEVRHDELEGVIAVGFEVGGRMISGGGPMVKVWEEIVGVTANDEEEDVAEGSTRGDGYQNGEENHAEDESDEAANDSSEDETKQRKRRKKRKRNKGKAGGGDGKHILSSFSGMD
jgi:hypothetical protein